MLNPDTMTYKEIQEEHRKIYNRTVKSCWIADVKRKLGYPVRISPNRIDKAEIKNKCPDRFFISIKTVIEKLENNS